MKPKYTKEDFLNKIQSIKNEDTHFITQYYDIDGTYDKVTHLVDCMKNMCEYYIYEYEGERSYPDLSKWQIVYNDILIEIIFDYDRYHQHSGLSLIYLENEFDKTTIDIDNILNIFSFLQPTHHYTRKSQTRQEIEKHKIEMIEKEKKRVDEIIDNREKKRIATEMKRQEIISIKNWYNYIINLLCKNNKSSPV